MGLQRMWHTAIDRALISLVLLDVTTTRRKASLMVVCIREALQRGSKGGGGLRGVAGRRSGLVACWEVGLPTCTQEVVTDERSSKPSCTAARAEL